VIDQGDIAAVSDSLDRGFKNMLDDLGEQTVDAIERGFALGTDATGRPWAPLAPETIRKKGHDTILVDKGKLRQAFDHERRGMRLEVFGEDRTLKWHEYGTENMPARPIMNPAGRYMTGRVDVAARRNIQGLVL